MNVMKFPGLGTDTQMLPREGGDLGRSAVQPGVKGQFAAATDCWKVILKYPIIQRPSESK